MTKRIALITAILTLTIAVGITIAATSNELDSRSSVTVHEWGTFTTVAGTDGQAIDWLPLSGPSDLPCFVLHFDSTGTGSPGIKRMPGPASNLRPLTYNDARSQLIGRVRMETPVLYFYAQKAQTLNVSVGFPHGFISEWYPKAEVTPTAVTNSLTSQNTTNASITWKGVRVMPGTTEVFPRSSASSHYYAARKTDAAPVRVDYMDEKFLFYRGIGDFPAPLNVTAREDGKLSLKHLQGKPSVIVFENRGGKLGYRLVDTSRNEAVVDAPALTADFESLRQDLQKVLVGQGLYEKEAAAMIETWKDSWFTEGTRVFYIVPSQMVDQILPLSITPKPSKTARVFVGRIEVFTPTTLNAVDKAIENKDQETLRLYGRFLGPIAERLMARGSTNRGAISNMLNTTYQSYISSLSKCAQ